MEPGKDHKASSLADKHDQENVDQQNLKVELWTEALWEYHWEMHFLRQTDAGAIYDESKEQE